MLLCEVRYVARVDSVWALLVSISIKVEYSVFAARPAQKTQNNWSPDLTTVVPYWGDGVQPFGKQILQQCSAVARLAQVWYYTNCE